MVHIILLQEQGGQVLMGYVTSSYCDLFCQLLVSTNVIFVNVNQAVIEERKEGDTTTGQATHKITRGINDKVCKSD